MIQALPEGDATEEEQSAKMDLETKRHQRKHSLILKYRNLEAFKYAEKPAEDATLGAPVEGGNNENKKGAGTKRKRT